MELTVCTLVLNLWLDYITVYQFFIDVFINFDGYS